MLFFPSRGLGRLPPPALLMVLYASCVIAGGLLLKTPLAAPAPISWSDAFFTATSAITVTGLIVIDTGSDLTWFGQFVVMILIQLGGLGLMTFAVFVLSALGLPVGLTHKMFLKEDLNQTSISELLRLVAVILRVVLVCEAAGVAALACVFVPDLGWRAGLWNALFHAISAFNNAGFALYPDSLTRWATEPLINLIIPALFITGGIGFVVISDIVRERRWRRFSLHSKLTLAGTAFLIVTGVSIFAGLEWTNPATLGALSGPWDKLQVAWFQGVTPRTAGFNTTDIGGMHDATALMMISMMLIGGGSTSTAGGIKVTTFIVLLLATIAFFKRRDELRAFKRSLGLEQTLKVMALTTISILIVFLGVFLVSISHDGDFLGLAFEVASAFGTVGLSRGETGELDALGRVVIMAIMFIGRVGPLTLGFFLATRSIPRIRYPEGQVYLG